MKDPEYNPYLYLIMCRDNNSEHVFSIFHNGTNAETKCKQLNADYGPRLSFHVVGLEAGDKPS
jgi:hypothetical protein